MLVLNINTAIADERKWSNADDGGETESAF